MRVRCPRDSQGFSFSFHSLLSLGGSGFSCRFLFIVLLFGCFGTFFSFTNMWFQEAINDHLHFGFLNTKIKICDIEISHLKESVKLCKLDVNSCWHTSIALLVCYGKHEVTE